MLSAIATGRTSICRNETTIGGATSEHRTATCARSAPAIKRPGNAAVAVSPTMRSAIPIDNRMSKTRTAASPDARYPRATLFGRAGAPRSGSCAPTVLVNANAIDRIDRIVRTPAATSATTPNMPTTDLIRPVGRHADDHIPAIYTTNDAAKGCGDRRMWSASMSHLTTPAILERE